MGKVTYRDGIAILQLVVFPIILVGSMFVWKRTGWRAGGKIWRFAVILSLLRIAGSIATLLTLSVNNEHVQVAILVCELIGIAPLSLTYIGLLKQIDAEERLPPKAMQFVPLISLIGLILAIVGVNKSMDSTPVQLDSLVKAAMGIFLAVFVLTILLTIYLFFTLSFSLRKFQKKLFIAIALSAPFYTVRLIYSAIGDFSTLKDFGIEGNTTIYLCMSVLEEIIAMIIVVTFGILAVLEDDFPNRKTAISQEDYLVKESQYSRSPNANGM